MTTSRENTYCEQCRTNKRGEKSHPWDVSNISVNYAYNEVTSSNTKTEIDVERNHKAGLNYNYNGNPANIAPFKNVKFLNAPVFRIIKDFNFMSSQSITIRNDLSRYYNEIKTRNINNPNLKIIPTFKKTLNGAGFSMLNMI